MLTTLHVKLSVKLKFDAKSETAVHGLEPRTSHTEPGGRRSFMNGTSVSLREQSTPK